LGGAPSQLGRAGSLQSASVWQALAQKKVLRAACEQEWQVSPAGHAPRPSSPHFFAPATGCGAASATRAGGATATTPASEMCTSVVRRQTSNTPLQALVLLDDPQYVEAYRVLAANVLRSEADPDVHVTMVFRLATRRRPTAEESARLRKYYDAQLERYAGDPAAASALLRNGVTAAPAGLDERRLAALTNLTAVVMNTPDAYTLR